MTHHAPTSLKLYVNQLLNGLPAVKPDKQLMSMRRMFLILISFVNYTGAGDQSESERTILGDGRHFQIEFWANEETILVLNHGSVCRRPQQGPGVSQPAG
jgi:hypothetical protein